MTLTFDTPVQSFGTLINYARFSDGKVHPDPVISAYDSANMLIASYISRHLHRLSRRVRPINSRFAASSPRVR